MYATYMGQNKEATQVATQYAVADLWEEAAKRDTVPPPPLVAPEVTVNTVNHAAATLQSSARYLSGTARKFLLAKFRPLAQDSLPEPTELSA